MTGDGPRSDSVQPSGSDSVTVRQFPDGKYVVRINDPACPHTWSSMDAIVSRTLRECPRLVALDLSPLTSFDTAGVVALAAAASQAGESDIALCLVAAHPGPVGAALRQADLEELFEVFDSVSEALASLP